MKTITEPINQKDIIYFIVTDRFYAGGQNTEPPAFVAENPNTYHGGNLAGIIEKIPYLKNLGITAVWITPVYLGIDTCVFNGKRYDNYHGYWPMDFEKIDPRLLDVNDNPVDRSALKKLVDALHDNEIKVILDIVVNHTGYHNQAYLEYGEKPSNGAKRLPDSWFSPKERWDLFGLPDLDHNLADVRDFFCNNILAWVEETGIDGIRMDTVSHVEEEFWYYFKAYVRGKHRHLFFLGEALDFDENTVALYQREHDFDSMFDFPLRGTIIDVLIKNEDFKPEKERVGMQAFARMRLNEREHLGVLDRDRKYNNANRLVTLVDNHDLEKRIMSWALQYSRGNLQHAVELVKYVLGFLLTTRGIPQLYYGTELALQGEASPDGDGGLRKGMPWSLIDRRTNEPYEDNKEVSSLFNHVKRLITLRKENEALTYGYLFTLYADFFVYVYLREFRGNTIIVAMNNGNHPMTEPVAVDISHNSNVPTRIKNNLHSRRLLANCLIESDKIEYSNGQVRLLLPGKTTAIYRLIDS